MNNESESNGTMKQKKITRATFKSFVNKNRGKLYVNTFSNFDPMVDCVTSVQSAFTPAQPSEWEENTLNVRGVWLVGSSRDHFKTYARDGFTGIEVSNCCGNFVVAIKE